MMRFIEGRTPVPRQSPPPGLRRVLDAFVASGQSEDGQRQRGPERFVPGASGGLETPNAFPKSPAVRRPARA
jgi:hypothetical protein